MKWLPNVETLIQRSIGLKTNLLYCININNFKQRF